MGFWAGFVAELNRYEDRKERERLLMQEVGSKRQENLLKLMASNTKRSKTSADEQAALTALATRAKVGEPEGWEEWVSAVAKTGKASELLKSVQDLELKQEGRELRIEGAALVGGVTPFYNPDTGSPDLSFTLADVANMDAAKLADDKTYFPMMAEAMGAEAASKQEGVVDINPQATYAATNKTRGEAEDYYDRRLLETFNLEGSSQSRADDAQWVADVKALSGDNAAAKVMARNRLMFTPEGLAVYDEMVNSDIPSYRDIGTIGGNFTVLDDARNVVSNWETFDPQQQQDYMTRYGFIQPIINEAYNVGPVQDVEE